MTVDLAEQRLGDLRWIVLRGGSPGESAAAFGALGEHMRAEIREVVAGRQALGQLRRHVESPPASGWLAAVRRASEAEFPQVWAELAALAEGAGVPVAELALLNFRGDLGDTRTGSAGSQAQPGPAGSEHARPERGTAGCSDLAWRRQRSYIAHNEDDSRLYEGRCALLTLAPDGSPPVTAFWKAGFLGSNTLAVTAAGPIWTIDALTVPEPGPGAGRHFVARGLQQAAPSTVGQVIDYLREHPSAGGFSYTVGDPTGRVAVVESAAGRDAWREVGEDGPLLWHTNHGRYIAGADDNPRGSSTTRGERLEALAIPAGEPDAGWFARPLTSAAPDGVRFDPSDSDDTATLCTLVVDLTAGEATVLYRGADPVAIPLADLAAGHAGAAASLPS